MKKNYVRQIVAFSDNSTIVFSFCCKQCKNYKICNLSPINYVDCNVESRFERIIGNRVIGKTTSIFLTEFYLNMQKSGSWKTLRELKLYLKDNFLQKNLSYERS